MRTLKIASVLALCGAANLAHAADIPGVLGDPGITKQTIEPTTDRYLEIHLGVVSEKAWKMSVTVTADLVDNKLLPEQRKCRAYTQHNPHTNTNHFHGKLSIHYARHSPDLAKVAYISADSLYPEETSQIRIGNQTFILPNVDDSIASYTKKKPRIALIDAIMRGRTATFSSHGPNGLIEQTFSLAGATAMAKLAARACDANSANPGKSEPTPTASRKTTSQPSQQARTTTQPRQQQTQTATHQPRTEDPLYDFAGDIADQGLQMVADEIINQMLGDF